MGAVCDLKLGEDVGDVVAYGLRAEEEVSGDLRIAVTPGDEAEDLALAGGELGEGFGGVGPEGGEEASDAARDLRPEVGLALRDGVEDLQDIGGLPALEHVAAGARAHGREYRVVVLEH